ncbi:hypothetical protein FEM48_Zijuj05G0022400 [Ziziphus jujuba var. spinosa]|uniref:Leucine-rich repeat-containing N-terminal plant-type domain-containing protein n=1 Tax=Ziziphus jujuba var. spinosa TaxID=714518 RepID=A0A978VC81_ZIZJJ|nr:hypothetical protein FEM48_Zijuj05G0022400 [Ziziphus jujuba var. spinosa]
MDCLEPDRQVLLELKNGLNDPEKQLSSWEGSNCCEWPGISCDNSSGAVIAVDLHNPYSSSRRVNKTVGLGVSELVQKPYTWTYSREHSNLKELSSLDLSNNRFSGAIPESLKSLSFLGYLNLSHNDLSGKIPYKDHMTTFEASSYGGNQSLCGAPLAYSDAQLMDCSKTDREALLALKNGFHDPENRLSSWKGSNCCQWRGISCENITGAVIAVDLHNPYPQGFDSNSKTLSLVVVLDLSGNNLSGDLPRELTNLLGLVFLNLSRNHISGHVPESISKLKELESLDLSNNRFSGAIPESLKSLSFLGYLNLSNNDLSGKIPYKDHMTTFEASSYGGNQRLCGAPLAVKCPGDEDDDDDPGNGLVIPKDNTNGDTLIDKWFYLSIGLGFAAGILVPYLVMAMIRSWGDAYFTFVDVAVERILYIWLKYRTILQRNRGRH